MFILTRRKAMDRALKTAFAATLRPAGFSGSFPHLRRVTDTQIDLLTVQYFSGGGKFVVEVGNCEPEGFVTHWGRTLGPKQVTVSYLGRERRRIGETVLGVGDPWFVFGPLGGEGPDSRVVAVDSHYEAIADQALLAVEQEAEPFWRGYADRKKDPPPLYPLR